MNTITTTNESLANHTLRVSHISVESKIEELKSLAEKQFIKKGQILFNKNMLARGVYYIDEGEVKVYDHGSGGKEQILKIVKADHFLGYEAVLGSGYHYTSAMVLENAVLLYISKNEFLNFCCSDSDITIFFMELMSLDIGYMQKKLTSLSYTPVRGRMAETLLELTDSNFNIDLKRADLSALIGTAKETTNRLLSELKSDNLINTDGKHITVTNPEGLKRLIHLYL